MFQDRIHAGEELAAMLSGYKNCNGIVLGIPRGGIPVAYVVARTLHLPLDVLLAHKIGHPDNKEYAIGAATLSDYFIVPHAEVPEAYIREELAAIRQNLKRKQHLYHAADIPEVAGKVVIIVDDGIATGNTIEAAIHLLQRQEPLQVIIAVPVAPFSAVQKLKQVADRVVVFHSPELFRGVGAFYRHFPQVEDEEVVEYLKMQKRNVES